MDVRATFQLTAPEYRSVTRNSPAIRTTLIISPLMAAFGLISRLSGGPATELLYFGLGLPVFIEVVVRVAARRSAALFAEPWTVRIIDETFAGTTPAPGDKSARS